MKNRLPKAFEAGTANGHRLSSRAARKADQQTVLTRKRALAVAGHSIGAHPVVSLTAAFVTGLIVAKWMRK